MKPKRAFIAWTIAGLSAGFFYACTPNLAPAHGEFDWIRHSADPDVRACCGIDDCHYVEAGKVEATGAGWYLHDTRELIPFDDAKRSRDGRFVRCHHPGDKTKTRCLFVPPGGS